MLRTKFKTGQALPLVFTRFLCPRISRGECLKRPRDMDRSRLRTRQIRELEQSQITMQTQTIHVREQSMSAPSPRPQTRSHTVRIRERITVATVREQAFAADTDCPQIVRSLELSTPPNSSRARTLREPRLAKDCLRWRIFVSIWSPANFPVRIRIIASYVLI